MSEPTRVPVPQMNVNDDQAVIVAWQVASGSIVAGGSPIATLETTKATFDVNAPCAGYLFHRYEKKTVVAVGATFAWIADDARVSLEALEALEAAPAASEAAVVPVDVDARLTRKAARRMRELGVGPELLPATGRIEVADIERLAAARPAPRAAMRGAVAGTNSQAAPDDCEPLEQSTSKIMEVARLTEVYRSAVPSSVTLPMSPGRVQERLRAVSAENGPVSLLELVIREAAVVLADYPQLNGYYAGRAWKYRHIAVGFAVNAGKALRVPVVRAAGGRSQLEVCRAVRDLTLRYFRDELSVEDVSGGTFTVTDLSGHGVTHMIPVLNDRQAAILGICAADLDGVQQNLVLTFDHRMADGMRGAEFLRDLRDCLEA